MWLMLLERMALEFLWHLVFFPVWWYTGGAKKYMLWCLERIADGNDILAPGLWLRNLFVPMFGQIDWQGRLMSFFMRLANVFFRSVFLFLWMVFVAGMLFAWFLFPLFVILMFFSAW